MRRQYNISNKYTFFNFDCPLQTRLTLFFSIKFNLGFLIKHIEINNTLINRKIQSLLITISKKWKGYYSNFYFCVSTSIQFVGDCTPSKPLSLIIPSHFYNEQYNKLYIVVFAVTIINLSHFLLLFFLVSPFNNEHLIIALVNRELKVVCVLKSNN